MSNLQVNLDSDNFKNINFDDISFDNNVNRKFGSIANHSAMKNLNRVADDKISTKLDTNTLRASIFDKKSQLNSGSNAELNDELNLESKGNDKLLDTALHSFSSHGLNDLDAAKLMSRVDSKFILPLSILPTLLSKLKNHYSVLEINKNRISSYHNQYFDTPDMALYHDHHNGKLNRYKIRRRRYVDTDTEFLEVKLKNNKKRTIKSRIMMLEESHQSTPYSQFISDKVQSNTNDLSVSNLNVSQQGGYKRIALANEAQAERLTLDFNLWYKSSDGDTDIKLPGFFIAELKQNKKSKRSPFYQMMSANNIFPMAFSKYCIGCALLYKSTIKSNRFKSILSHIDKLNRIENNFTLKSN